jgi:hypothetical protein
MGLASTGTSSSWFDITGIFEGFSGEPATPV